MLPVTRLRAHLCFALLGSACGCGGPPAQATPPTAARPEAPRASARPSVGPSVASASQSAAPSAAPAVEPHWRKRMPAATAAQVAGQCTLGSPIQIGTSSIADEPHFVINASVAGVVAAWVSSDNDITTIALDSTGRARGEPRVLKSQNDWDVAGLWELGDGMFVLGFEPFWGWGQLSHMALQRIDASGEPVGQPVSLGLDKIEDVASFQNELWFLTSAYGGKVELLRVTSTQEGLAARQVALPESPKGMVRQQRLLVTSKGAARVVTELSDGSWSVDREDGPRATLKLPDAYTYARPALDADDEVVWPKCGPAPTVRAIKAAGDAAAEVTVDRSVCAAPPAWSVTEQVSDYLGFSAARPLVLERGPADPVIKLPLEARKTWRYVSTWSGTHVLAMYAQRRGGRS